MAGDKGVQASVACPGPHPAPLLARLLKASPLRHARFLPAPPRRSYAWRSSAEFAKVAMHQQSLDGSSMGEVLDVRWVSAVGRGRGSL